MVQTWASEPSPHVSYLGNGIPSVLENKKTTTFSHTPRFVRDGTNNPEKQPNFLNGWDKQGLELAAKHVDVDTNTHTAFSAPLMHGFKHNLDIAEQVHKGLWSTPAIRSTSPKRVTPRSLVNNDTRYNHAKDSYSEPIGPGHYWIEGGLPSLGPLPREMSSKSVSPLRNPETPCASFRSPARPDPFPPRCTPDDWRMGTNMPVSNNIAPWSEQTSKRIDVSDYRSAGRISEAKKEVPYDAQYPKAEGINMAGACTRLAAGAPRSKSPARSSTSAFESKQHRLAPLPRARINDMRLSRKFEDDDSQWLGPGAYTPLTSVGGAKRKSYKLFNVSQPPIRASRLSAGQLGARSAIVPQSLSKKSPPSKSHLLRHVPQPAGSSSSFSTTTRSHKYGPHTWQSDSSLTRTV